jgi:hypothetical protein
MEGIRLGADIGIEVFAVVMRRVMLTRRELANRLKIYPQQSDDDSSPRGNKPQSLFCFQIRAGATGALRKQLLKAIKLEYPDQIENGDG